MKRTINILIELQNKKTKLPNYHYLVKKNCLNHKKKLHYPLIQTPKFCLKVDRTANQSLKTA
jgi:hypothetical protein